jgi:hypothetical protein
MRTNQTAKAHVAAIQGTEELQHRAQYNPLMTNAKSSSDWAESFSTVSFLYLKNIIFYALIFYFALLKIY